MSWQLTLLNAQLRWLIKPILHRTKGPEQARADFERTARWFFRTPPGLSHIVRPNRLHWLRSGPAQRGQVILYFHGGGYVAGSPRSHAGLVGRLARLSGVEVCAPDYRLAQEAPFPAAFEDACAAWSALRDMGYKADNIVLGGDSAGGGLALALLAHVLARGEAPAGLFAFSPWTDLACTGSSLQDNAHLDAVLPVARIHELVDIYLHGTDPKDPRASPLYAGFTTPPPILIQYSETEILRDDSLRMAKRLRAAGADVTLSAEKDAPHVWQIFDGWLPEARISLREAARFVQGCLPDTIR